MKIGQILAWVSVAALPLVGAEYSADVVVYGGTSGGVIAAVAAAQAGRSTLLLEPGRHLGGMTSGGLGQVDIFRPETLGGLTMEFFRRAADCPNGRLFWVTPTFSERVFRAMARERGVRVLEQSRLAEGVPAVKEDGAIKSITLENGDVVRGRVFIDATYEGDLIKAAGVPYRVGREGRDEYGESAAGVRPSVVLADFDVYDSEGQLAADLVEDVPGKVGEADGNSQAYNFRLCMTRDVNNMVKVEKPANYRREDYHNLAKMINADPGRYRTFNDIISYWGMLSGGTKADINNRGDFSSDYINHSHDWAEASYAERDRIFEEHKNFIQGLLYFIANDEQVPEALRKDCASWGLAADEFTDTDNWPHQLYVRESRRMVGDYVMTQDDAYLHNTKPDSVGIGSYMLDSHAVRKYAYDGKVYMEGFISVFDGKVPIRPYEIPYRSLTPKREDCANLLSVVCLSASHVIYCSLRMEPVFMTVGEAAGRAAAMAVEHAVPVQEVDVAELQRQLVANGCHVNYPGGNKFPLKSELASDTRWVLDEKDAKLTGKWTFGEVGVPMVDGRFAAANHDDNVRMEYEWTVPEDGRYKFSIIVPRSAGSVRAMPIEFKQNRRKYTLLTDLSDTSLFEEELHRFPAKKGDKVTITVTNEGRSQALRTDAVIFEKIK